ncbi:hypothetical protein [Kitasatospora sp. NBC_01266]|uniref:hypothetical protein n=1 Tax=Kitasatospora sp. NBC_01266 TaxID=2903572 RepID=UPI002E2F4A8B|nr:hypothetical protein [Kitasatospora sp. NBC_01266]
MTITQDELNEGGRTAFLATKATFLDAMAQLCDAAGADLKALSYALSLDARIGPMDIDHDAYDTADYHAFMAQLEAGGIPAGPLDFFRLMDHTATA